MILLDDTNYDLDPPYYQDGKLVTDFRPYQSKRIKKPIAVKIGHTDSLNNKFVRELMEEMKKDNASKL